MTLLKGYTGLVCTFSLVSTTFARVLCRTHHVPLLVPNVVGGTLNVVTHALPELPQEKKEGRKKRRKRGESAFFSLYKLGRAWVATFSAQRAGLEHNLHIDNMA